MGCLAIVTTVSSQNGLLAGVEAGRSISASCVIPSDGSLQTGRRQGLKHKISQSCNHVGSTCLHSFYSTTSVCKPGRNLSEDEAKAVSFDSVLVLVERTDRGGGVGASCASEFHVTSSLPLLPFVLLSPMISTFPVCRCAICHVQADSSQEVADGRGISYTVCLWRGSKNMPVNTPIHPKRVVPPEPISCLPLPQIQARTPR